MLGDINVYPRYTLPMGRYIFLWIDIICILCEQAYVNEDVINTTKHEKVSLFGSDKIV